MPGCLGGAWVTENGDRSRNQLRAAVSSFLGTHSLKAGVEYRHSKYTDLARAAGPPSGPLVDANGVVVVPDGVPGASFQLNDFCPLGVEAESCYVLRVDDYDSQGTTDEVGLFVSDEWQILSNLTVNAGVRFDSLQATGNGTALHPDRRLDFSMGDRISPRASVIWDPSKQGRSRVFASYGQFSESIPMDVNDYAFGDAGFDLYFFAYPENGSLPTYNKPRGIPVSDPDCARHRCRPLDLATVHRGGFRRARVRDRAGLRARAPRDRPPDPKRRRRHLGRQRGARTSSPIPEGPLLSTR